MKYAQKVAIKQAKQVSYHPQFRRLWVIVILINSATTGVKFSTNNYTEQRSADFNKISVTRFPLTLLVKKETNAYVKRGSTLTLRDTSWTISNLSMHQVRGFLYIIRDGYISTHAEFRSSSTAVWVESNVVDKH